MTRCILVLLTGCAATLSTNPPPNRAAAPSSVTETGTDARPSCDPATAAIREAAGREPGELLAVEPVGELLAVLLARPAAEAAGQPAERYLSVGLLACGSAGRATRGEVPIGAIVDEPEQVATLSMFGADLDGSGENDAVGVEWESHFLDGGEMDFWISPTVWVGERDGRAQLVGACRWKEAFWSNDSRRFEMTLVDWTLTPARVPRITGVRRDGIGQVSISPESLGALDWEVVDSERDFDAELDGTDACLSRPL